MAENPIKSDSYVEKLTAEQREEIRQAFSFYDRDGDDKIKTSELGIVIRSLGHGKFYSFFVHRGLPHPSFSVHNAHTHTLNIPVF